MLHMSCESPESGGTLHSCKHLLNDLLHCQDKMEEEVRPSQGGLEEQCIMETLKADCDCILKADFISLVLILKYVDSI